MKLKGPWKRAAAVLAVALVLVLVGLYMGGKAVFQVRHPREVSALAKTVTDFGGADGIVRRQKNLNWLQGYLRNELIAKSSGHAELSRRIEEVFAEVGLAVTSSSAWEGARRGTTHKAVAYERTFSGTGGFQALLDAVHTLESWPDGVRVRHLEITPRAPETVAFTLRLSAARLVVPSRHARPPTDDDTPAAEAGS